MSRTEPSATGTRTPGVERSIGERPSDRRGEPVTGIRRIYPPEAKELQDETPTAAQAAVGVSVCGDVTRHPFPISTTPESVAGDSSPKETWFEFQTLTETARAELRRVCKTQVEA